MHGNIGILIPIIAIIAAAWVITVALTRRGRGPHGYGSSPGAQSGENARLASENKELRNTVERLEERLQVLERIATDPAERTAREIEQLR